MKKLLKYFLVCILLCAVIAGISTAFADVCPVHGSQHLFTEASYEAAHPHRDYEACKCGYANYTGGTRTLDNCKECQVCSVHGVQHLFTEEGYEAAHPHKDYEACKCGYVNYTGGTRTLDDCAECNSEDNGPAHTPDYPEDETCEHTSKVKTNTQIVDYQQLTSDLWPDVTHLAATHHAIIHTYTLQCTDCQKTFDPITELMCLAGHHFDNQGVCKECNYCTHQNLRKEYLGEGTVINKDDYDYHYIEMPYEGSCSYCGAVVDGIDEDYEFHEYDHDGWCFCSYYNEDYCPHDNTELRDAGYGYGVDGLIEETRHFTEHCYEEYCFDCDTIIGSGWADSGEHNPWWEGYWEDHDFGADGYCVCGYYQEPEVCSHENSELRLTDTTYSMDEYDAEMHWAQYYYDVYCFDCKQVVNTTWEGQGEGHVFNESGYCSACGFQRAPAEITEPLQVTISVWSRNALVGDRVGADATVSGGSGNYTYHWEASSDTQKYIQSGSNYTHRSWGYNANSACTWKITVTVTDEETGEQKSATTTGIKVSEAVIEIQSLKCNKGTQGWELGDQLTFQAVVKGGSGNYQIAWKVTKDGNIVKEDNFSANEKFAFVIDETGYWQVTAIATDVQNNGSSEAATRGETVIGGPLQVSISSWKEEATLGSAIGADATIVGGSGSYTCHWAASSENHELVQDGTGASSSWGFLPSAIGKWRISVTVHDINTGERKTASTSSRLIPLKIDSYELLNTDLAALRKRVTDTSLFDIKNIRRAVYLNDSRGAYIGSSIVNGGAGPLAYLVRGTIDHSAGHAGLLLIDEQGRSVYFSCLGPSSDEEKAVMVIRYLDETETDRMLHKGNALIDCNEWSLKTVNYKQNGTVLESFMIPQPDSMSDKEFARQCEMYWPGNLETTDFDDVDVHNLNAYSNNCGLLFDTSEYDRAIGFDVTSKSGELMYNRMLSFYTGDVYYDFMNENCDYYVLKILQHGTNSLAGVEIDKLIDIWAPNQTYNVLVESIETGNCADGEVIK